MSRTDGRPFQDIEKPKHRRLMDGRVCGQDKRMDNVKTVYLPQTQFVVVGGGVYNKSNLRWGGGIIKVT